MKLAKIFASISLALSASIVLAAGGGGAGGSVVFDPSNFGKNTLTATQTAKQVEEQIQTRLVQLEQLKEEVRQSQALPEQDGHARARELANRVANMAKMYQEVKKLTGNLETLQGRHDFTMQMAQRFNLTLKEYIAKRDAEAKRKQERAIVEREANKAAIRNVQDSYEQVAKWQTSLPETNTASFQRLNQQMALLNAQNAQLMAHFVQQDDRRIDEENEAAAKKAAGQKDSSAESESLAAQAANARKALTESFKKQGASAK